MMYSLKRRDFLRLSLSSTALLASSTLAFGKEQKQTVVRIALITDTHTTHATKEDQALYIPRFEQVIAAVHAAAPDLILFAGDQTQSGQQGEIEAFMALAKQLTAPTYWVPGNHDIGAKHIPGKEGGTTSERNADYERHFGASYFSETVAGLQIVGINTPVLGSGLPIEDEQWRFLNRSLGGNAIQDAKPILVLLHYPPYLKTENEPGGDYWNIEPEPRSRLLKLLDNNPRIRAVLSGHLHYPIHYTRNNVPYWTGAPVSFGLPRGKQPQGWTLLTVPIQDTLTATITAEFFPILDNKEPKS